MFDVIYFFIDSFDVFDVEFEFEDVCDGVGVCDVCIIWNWNRVFADEIV